MEALPYRAAASGAIGTRLGVMRLASGLFALLNTVAAWLLAGELFGRRRLPQLVTAATVGLWPMMSFLSAAVTPDALLYPLWTLALWQGVRILRHGLTAGRGVLLGGLVAAGVLTKVTTLALSRRCCSCSPGAGSLRRARSVAGARSARSRRACSRWRCRSQAGASRRGWRTAARSRRPPR